MRGMKTGLNAMMGTLGLAVLLAACNVDSTTPDNSLRISNPTVKTEYYDTINSQYVVCANVNSVSAANLVRVTVTASTAPTALHVQLIGETSSRYGSAYDTTFSGGNLNVSADRYSGLFEQPAVTGSDSEILPQGIVVNPATRPVKFVTTAESDRVAGGYGGFHATVVGTSSTGQTTNTLTTGSVPSYVNCALQGTSSDPV
ncbi:hypothetical protein GCM10008939_01440 [Deinococcus aquiradiocola]|uniref:Lipoprotein n=2 Tax=Deinococcus aquiradiocola TaxID=393059 RepID=A0A917UJM1_9DEIO|nr:hypothetical protein GCM10008939_01440 [Deinococcus aquiradiocola]